MAYLQVFLHGVVTVLCFSFVSPFCLSFLPLLFWACVRPLSCTPCGKCCVSPTWFRLFRRDSSKIFLYLTFRISARRGVGYISIYTRMFFLFEESRRNSRSQVGLTQHLPQGVQERGRTQLSCQRPWLAATGHHHLAVASRSLEILIFRAAHSYVVS